MNRNKLLLWIQSLLCVALAVLLAVTALGVYREGVAARATDPLAAIYTREKAAAALRRCLPLGIAAAGVTALCLALGVKDTPRPARGGKIENRQNPGVKSLHALLLLAAVGLIAAGVLNGSARDVFGKAVKICTECVGLG